MTGRRLRTSLAVKILLSFWLIHAVIFVVLGLVPRSGPPPCGERPPRGPGHWQGSPSWSPDGRQIAFDSRDAEDRLANWTIDADGGIPRRITNDPGDQNMPTWSRDGRWIYFASDQGAGRDIWRVPARGGSPERVTRDGSAMFALESMDGKDLIYKRDLEDAPLMALPLAGGPARQLLPCVTRSNFAVGSAGIYYAACGPEHDRSLHLIDRAGRDRVLGIVRDVWGFCRRGKGLSKVLGRNRFAVDRRPTR